jgi:hypothetical protein
MHGYAKSGKNMHGYAKSGNSRQFSAIICIEFLRALFVHSCPIHLFNQHIKLNAT